MIEIIKDGNDKKYEAICPKCDSTIGYTIGDIKNRTETFKGLGFTKYEYYGFLNMKTRKVKETTVMEKEIDYIPCPKCGNPIHLNERISDFNKDRIIEVCDD